MMPNDMAKRVEKNYYELNLGHFVSAPNGNKNKIRKLEKAHNVFINDNMA